MRAAVAVELVHSATLVHDDLIDGAALRRGHPTVAAQAGRRAAVATGDLLFSRAFSELARNEDPAQLQALSDASSALAEGELLQREDAYCAGCFGGPLSRPLCAEDGSPVRGGLPSGGAVGGRAVASAGGRAGRLRAADRARLPGPRRRARRLRAGRADGQAARQRPAGGDRDAALHPRPGTREGARGHRPARAEAGPSRPRSCASGSPLPAPSSRPASGRWRSSPRPRRCSPGRWRGRVRCCWTSSPTRSSSVTTRSRWA